jgi:hypothetical protein
MVALRSPLLDLQLDPQAALYVAHLERQLCVYQINEVKFRALLEMLTGESWDDLALDLENKQLFDIAVALAEKKLNVTNMEARKIIRARQAQANSEGNNKEIVAADQ